jgi:hypothetical protein
MAFHYGFKVIHYGNVDSRYRAVSVFNMRYFPDGCTIQINTVIGNMGKLVEHDMIDILRRRVQVAAGGYQKQDEQYRWQIPVHIFSF